MSISSISLIWKFLLHYAHAVLARLDVTAWLGIVMLLGAAGVGAATWVLERDVQTLAQHTVDLRHRFEKLAAAQSALDGHAPSLPDYYAGFPDAEQVPIMLKALHDAAAKSGFDLTMADYREAAVAGTPLARYEVSLQVKANYPQLRAWLADTLNDWPTLALVECTIKRDNVLTPAVQAQLRFSLFYRSH